MPKRKQNPLLSPKFALAQSRPRSFGQDFHGDKWSPAG